MTDPQALIFDVDGTLSETERDGHRVAFNQAFRDVGLDWNWSVELYGRLLSVTGGKERIRHYLDRYRPDFKRPDDLDGFIADLHQAKTAHYTALVARGGIPLRPGVERLLKEARAAGWRLAIATTTTPQNVEALIQSTLPEGAMEWFEAVGAGDIVPQKKPAPDIYAWVLGRLGLAPGQVIVFEDSGPGVASATGAGISTILVTLNDYTADHDFSGATAVFETLGEPTEAAVCRRGVPPSNGVIDLAFLRTLMPASL